ncbi:MAG: metal ABC transporter substrate-binding protein [Bacillota bacterium]
MRSKRIRIVCILMTLMLLVAAGCSKETNQRPQSQTEEKRLIVYTTIYPMYDFAQKIGGDKVDVRLMIPPGAEPHDWEPTAKLMAALEEADVLIYNGVEIEPWIDKVLGSLSNKNIVIVEASEDIELIKFEEHAHEDNEEEQLAEEEDDHGEYDPHVWLDPTNAAKEAENIMNAFIKADEDNKELYEANYQAFKEKIAALDQKYQQELRDVKRKEIVVAHAAFGYLTHKYGLEQISINGLSPQEEPSAAKLAEIAEEVKEHEIKYIFFETLTSPKLSQVLAEETGAKTAVLNPIDGLTEEEMKAGKDYFAVMEENLHTLKTALGE